MIYKHLLFFILQLILAAPAAVAKPQPQADKASIEVRQPPADKLSEYREDGDFTYEATPKEAASLLNKIKYWIRDTLDEFLSQPGTKKFLKIAFYFGFAAIILMLLNQLMKGNVKRLFLGKNPLKPRTFSVKEADGGERDLNRLIREAVENNQLALAVRYLYQRSLVQLQNSGYINWKKNKTNRDYLYEIQGNELRGLFREVTRYYEYAEYGNFAVNSADFEKVQDRFNKMEKLMET